MARKPNILLIDDAALKRDARKNTLPDAEHRVVSRVCRIAASLLKAEGAAQLQSRAGVSPALAAQRPNEDATSAQGRRDACPTAMAAPCATPAF